MQLEYHRRLPDRSRRARAVLAGLGRAGDRAGRQLRFKQAARPLRPALSTAGVGIVGVVICLFWLFTAIFAATHRALRSARPDPDHEERAARRHRAGRRQGLSASAATSSRATSSAAWSIGSQIVLIIAPAATALRADGRHHARPAGRLLRRQDRHRPVVPRQPGAGLPGDPAVLPAGHAGHHGHADPLCHGGRLLPVPDHLLLRCCSTRRFKNRPRAPLSAARPDAGARRLGLCRPRLQRRSARHHLDRPEPAQHLRRGGLRLEPRRVPHRARPRPWTSRRATMSPRRRPAAKRPGTSCCGRSCPMRAGR